MREILEMKSKYQKGSQKTVILLELVHLYRKFDIFYEFGQIQKTNVYFLIIS